MADCANQHLLPSPHAQLSLPHTPYSLSPPLSGGPQPADITKPYIGTAWPGWITNSPTTHLWQNHARLQYLHNCTSLSASLACEDAGPAPTYGAVKSMRKCTGLPLLVVLNTRCDSLVVDMTGAQQSLRNASRGLRRMWDKRLLVPPVGVSAVLGVPREMLGHKTACCSRNACSHQDRCMRPSNQAGPAGRPTSGWARYVLRSCQDCLVPPEVGQAAAPRVWGFGVWGCMPLRSRLLHDAKPAQGSRLCRIVHRCVAQGRSELHRSALHLQGPSWGRAQIQPFAIPCTVELRYRKSCIEWPTVSRLQGMACRQPQTPTLIPRP